MIKTRRFVTDKNGATAVEFALIAAPFFALLFAILEVALVFFGGALLDQAVEDVSRDIRTGEITNRNTTQQDFHDLICEGITLVMDCNNLTIDVRPINDFAAFDFTVPLTAEGELDGASFTFDSGDTEERVMVRAFYEWQLLGPRLINGMSNMSNNRIMMTSTTAFRNEPY